MAKTTAVISRVAQRRKVVRPSLVTQDEVLTPSEERAIKRGTRDIAAGRTVEWNEYKKARALDRKSR